MKNKTLKKVWKSTLSILGILSLALVVFSSYALIYTQIYENPWMYFGIGVGILALLVVIGGMSWKKIKNKIVDIFT